VSMQQIADFFAASKSSTQTSSGSSYFRESTDCCDAWHTLPNQKDNLPRFNIGAVRNWHRKCIGIARGHSHACFVVVYYRFFSRCSAAIGHET
jgi:hypothetical protein